MSLYLTGGVAVAYAVGVVAVHRVTVARRRATAQGYPTLKWLDWNALLQGLLEPEAPHLDRPLAGPPEGGPPPMILARERSAKVQVLEALVKGTTWSAQAFEQAAFSGGEARWLELLADLREAPRQVLEELEATSATTPAEAYLREWLTLEHEVSPLNLELVTFSSKRRISRALQRFGHDSALYSVRAKASSLLGFNNAVLDDLARAVYFSRQAPFYLEAVIQMPFIEEARPALLRACKEAKAR